MSKRNKVSFIKPADPKFLRIMKEQIGYKEGPDIEAKRQRLEDQYNSDSDPDFDEEQPQVVVLRSGDLTAEEAEEARLRIEKENDEKPADLSEKIVFKSKKKQTAEIDEDESVSSTNKSKSTKDKQREEAKSKLSFGDDDDDEDEDTDE